MQTHIKFLEHQYNQAYKELDFETAEEFYRIKEILIDLNEKQVSVEPEIKPEIASKKVEYIKQAVDRIWVDCFDAPPSFTQEQMSVIGSAIAEAKLTIEKQFSV